MWAATRQNLVINTTADLPYADNCLLMCQLGTDSYLAIVTHQRRHCSICALLVFLMKHERDNGDDAEVEDIHVYDFAARMEDRIRNGVNECAYSRRFLPSLNCDTIAFDLTSKLATEPSRPEQSRMWPPLSPCCRQVTPVGTPLNAETFCNVARSSSTSSSAEVIAARPLLEVGTIE